MSSIAQIIRLPYIMGVSNAAGEPFPAAQKGDLIVGQADGSYAQLRGAAVGQTIVRDDSVAGGWAFRVPIDTGDVSAAAQAAAETAAGSLVQVEEQERSAQDAALGARISTLEGLNSIPTSEKGQINGVATLGPLGQVPESQLPDVVQTPDALGPPDGFPVVSDALIKVPIRVHRAGSLSVFARRVGAAVSAVDAPYRLDVTKGGVTVFGEPVDVSSIAATWSDLGPDPTTVAAGDEVEISIDSTGATVTPAPANGVEQATIYIQVVIS